MTQRLIWTFAFPLFLLCSLALGCSEGGPPGQAGSDSKFVGGPCMDNAECEFILCETGAETPGGTCSSSCSDDSDCSSGSSCVVTGRGWVCLVSCTSDDQCRTDYSCQDYVLAPPPSEEEEQPTLTRVCAGIPADS